MNYKLAALFSFICVSSNCFAGMNVTAKHSLEVGLEQARSAAIKTALVEASYQKGARVSSVTEIQNLAISESNSVVRTNSLISEYSVIEEYECGQFYCVELDVEFDSDSVDPEHKAHVVPLYVKKNVVGQYTEQGLKFIDDYWQAYLINLASDGGYQIVSSPDYSDVLVELDFNLVEEDSFFGSFFSKKHYVGVSYTVSNDEYTFSEKLISESATDLTTNYLLSEFPLMNDLLQQTNVAVKKIPSVESYLVSTIENDRVFLKYPNQQVGSVFLVEFEDLKEKKFKTFHGVIVSVFGDDVIVELNVVPSSSMRLRNLTKLAF